MTSRNARIVRRNHGSTLIELMIAIIIGLIMVLASFQVMAVFEGHKRTTTAMNDALQSGGFGLYSLDKLASSSGSGLVQSTSFAYGCLLNYTASPSGVVVAGGIPASTLQGPFGGVLAAAGGALRLAPAVIFPGASPYPAGQPSDVFMLMSGGAGYGEVPVPLTALPTAAQLTLDSTVGMSPNDWILIGASGAANCTITPIVATLSNVVLSINSPSSLAAYTNGYVADLGNGQAASFMLYGVGNYDALYSIDLLNSDASTAQKVGDDIVTMHAVYGVDPSVAGTGPITWTNPVAGVVIAGTTYDYSPTGLLSGTTAATTAMRSIKAIRVAIIVRAPLSERWSSSDTTINTASNAINAGAYTMFLSLPPAVQVTWTVPTGDGEEDYRYRELEGTIPLRNASF